MNSQSNQFGVSDKKLKLSEYAVGALSVIEQFELVFNSLISEMKDAVVASGDIVDAKEKE